MGEKAISRMEDDPARSDELVLVDALDAPVGSATKERAHVEGLLHRAFSVVLVREGEHAGEPQVLLSRRASGKYHSGGLWANSCCSHPRVGEQLGEAVARRVQEELGCSVRDLREIGSFVYRTPFADGLVEYEFDHVFVGACEGALTPDVSEVDALWWVGIRELGDLLVEYPHLFASWALTVLPMVLAHGVSV